jgi:oligoribonuclease
MSYSLTMTNSKETLLGDFPNITWIDVETSGLDENTEHLFEVAALVTDRNLNILDPNGFNMTIRYSPEEVAAIYETSDPYVQNMHKVTGLWEKLPNGTPLAEVDDKLHEYISQFATPKTSWLGGNSITLDRNFLRVNLPQSFGYLSYRSFDVTTVSGLAKAWYGLNYEKKLLHAAFSDIMESIEELRFYRENIFKTIPTT